MTDTCPECLCPVRGQSGGCEHPCHVEAIESDREEYRRRMTPPSEETVQRAVWDARGGPAPPEFRGFA